MELIYKESEVVREIGRQFKHKPTVNQEEAIKAFGNFMFAQTTLQPLFLLTGYAGTGKTTLISAIVKALDNFKIKTNLLAPTGRAAKVMGLYANRQANTIHKRIYFRQVDGAGAMRFTMQQNLHKHTLFIIDEASMIADGVYNAEGRSLLNDLLEYVYTGFNCRVMLVGDNAQLPPVGLSESPALNADYLKKSYSLELFEASLKEVMRQQLDSGILFNATNLRIQLLSDPNSIPKFNINSFSDIVRIDASEMSDCLEQSYRNHGVDGAIVVCRSNKRANLFNQQIRHNIKMQENEIAAGDLLMVVKNNYFWLPEGSVTDFIANGDVLEIRKLKNFKSMHGLNFVDATVQLVDYPQIEPFETKLLLDAISVDGPSISQEQSKAFYAKVEEDYLYEPNKTKRKQLIKQDPWLNALQIKFAYAVTCHKSQGGQWPHVYIDIGYFTEEMLGPDYLRWLYTAITRASDKVYLFNFKDEFFV